MEAEIEALRAQYVGMESLGRSSEGTRYAAALVDGTPVEVFVLRPALTARVRDTDAFLTALRTASSFRSDHLVPLVAAGFDQGVLHCGYALPDAGRPAMDALSSDRVAAIGVELGRALHAMHRAGRVHGAIATERIRLTKDGAPRLTGAGLFSALVAGGLDVMSASSELCDAAYVSPEQLRGESPAAHSDVYALGATLYELLTGKPPFGGRTTSYIMATVLPEEPTSGVARATRADVVIHALLRAIEHAPEDRWPTANAFATALMAAAETAGENSTSGDSIGRLWSRFAAIFGGAWFPAGRSRE